jgi:GAF domain-containing protein
VAFAHSADNHDVRQLDSSSTPKTLAWAMADAARFLNEPAEDVDTVLARLADVASRTIPGVDMASISVATRTGISTKAATAQPARDLDQLQYDWQEGPCIDALSDPDKGEVVVDDMDREQRWPRYAPAAATHGVRSQMGIEIYREGSSVGGLNLYSKQANAFHDETRAGAEIFAVHAAVAMDKARAVTSMTEALASRQVIGQAVGIVMHTYTVNEGAAFGYLTRVSQTTNTKLREVAARVVANAAEEADSRLR